MKIGIILNPQARSGDPNKYRPLLEAIAERHAVELCWLTGSDAQHTVRNARQAVVENSIDALVAMGGDGMVHLGLQAVAGTEMPLGIIALGSGNDIAREFSLPIHAPEVALTQIIDALRNKKIRVIDSMKIITQHESTYALAIASFGVDADVNYRTNKLRWPKGNLRYVRALFPALSAYKPYGVRISVNGKTAQGDMLLLCVANTRYFGGGFNIAPTARVDDGKLNVILLRSVRFWELAQLLPKLLLRRHLQDKRVHEIITTKIHVEAASEAGIHPPHVMADGEYVADLPLTIKVCPKSVHLIV